MESVRDTTPTSNIPTPIQFLLSYSTDSDKRETNDSLFLFISIFSNNRRYSATTKTTTGAVSKRHHTNEPKVTANNTFFRTDTVSDNDGKHHH